MPKIDFKKREFKREDKILLKENRKEEEKGIPKEEDLNGDCMYFYLFYFILFYFILFSS